MCSNNITAVRVFNALGKLLGRAVPMDSPLLSPPLPTGSFSLPSLSSPLARQAKADARPEWLANPRFICGPYRFNENNFANRKVIEPNSDVDKPALKEMLVLFLRKNPVYAAILAGHVLADVCIDHVPHQDIAAAKMVTFDYFRQRRKRATALPRPPPPASTSPQVSKCLLVIILSCANCNLTFLLHMILSPAGPDYDDWQELLSSDAYKQLWMRVAAKK